MILYSLLLIGLSLYLSIFGSCYENVGSLGEPKFGLNLGSIAASTLLKNGAKFAINHPKPIHIDLRSDESPLFGPIAMIDTRTGITLGPMDIHFRNNKIHADLMDFHTSTVADVTFLTLPFLGDTLHVDITVERASVDLKLHSMNISIDNCKVSVKDISIHVERTIFLNPLLYLFSYSIPTSVISNQVCSAISEALINLQKDISVGIPFTSIIPPKFAHYLSHPNIFLYAKPESIIAKDEQLTLNVALDWYNGTENTKQQHQILFDKNLTSSDDFALSIASNFPSFKHFETSPQNLSDVSSHQSESDDDYEAVEKLHLWVEDRLLNELLQQFHWDFMLIQESIPLNDQKIPDETREFLRTLCETCLLLVNVTANGPPFITVDNRSLIIDISDRVALAVKNPETKRVSTLIDLSLTLMVALTPTIENGIFRTHLNLLDRQIKIQNGTAAPKSFFQQLSEMLTKTISEDIWPALQKGLGPLIYKEGVRIPPRCGIKPASAQLHFDGGRFGASAALDLDNLAIDQCMHHLRDKLPTLEKIFVTEVSTTTVSPFLKYRKRW